MGEVPQNIFYEEDALTTWYSFLWLNCHPIQMGFPFISGKECIDLPMGSFQPSLLTVYCFSLKIHTSAFWLSTSLLWGLVTESSLSRVFPAPGTNRIYWKRSSPEQQRGRSHPGLRVRPQWDGLTDIWLPWITLRLHIFRLLTDFFL